MPVSPVVYCVRHQLFSDFCFIENISEFRYITTSFSGIKQLHNALRPFLKYFVFRSLGYINLKLCHKDIELMKTMN